MSVEKIVLGKLKSQEWVSNSELEDMFPKGTKGHYSWPQRLRGLRDKGYEIIRRTKLGTNNLSEWHLVDNEPLPTEQEEILIHHNLGEEKKINLSANKQFEFAGIR